MTRDFRLQIFFMNQCSPGICLFSWGRLDFFRKFTEIFANEYLSPVPTTPAISYSPVSPTPAINPCHGFSVIVGVVEIGDKFMACDNENGDKFIAGDNDADNKGESHDPHPPASAAQAASTAWVVPLSFFLFSTILCTVYTYGVHGAQLFSVVWVIAIINLHHFSCWLVLPFWSSFLCYLRPSLPIFQ
jgi:hypothetical protein